MSTNRELPAISRRAPGEHGSIRGAALALCFFIIITTLAPLAMGQSAWRHKNIHARYGHSTVFDPVSNRMIILAGQHAKNFPDDFDLWFAVYTPGSTALQMIPATLATGHPSARFGHTAVLDSTNNRMVIFGGGTGTSTPGPCLNDVWLLQNANGVSATPAWTQQRPGGTVPSARFAPTAVYDATTNTMILFGGYDCSANYLNDVWILNNANGLGGTPTWTQLSVGGTVPSGREAATAVYDPTNNVMTIHGGDVGTAVDGDVWVLSHANGMGGTPTWTQLAPTGPAPAARSGHSAIYDAANNRMTVYGGQTSNSVSNLLNDFWVLTNANGIGGAPAWTQLTPQTPGAFRSFHTAVYDAAVNTMLIFGGKTSISLLPADDHVTVVTQANGLQP